MRVSGPHHQGGVDPSGEKAADEGGHADAGAGAKKTQTSKSDPTGLGWRAKLSGQSGERAPAAAAASHASHAGGAADEKKWIDGVKGFILSEMEQGEVANDFPQVKKGQLPDAAQKSFAKYMKEYGPDYPPQAFTMEHGGKPFYLILDQTDGGYFAEVFDKSGKHIASGSQSESGDFSWSGDRATTTTPAPAKPATTSATTPAAGGAAITKAAQNAWDNGDFSASVDRKALPAAAQKQFDIDAKAGKEDGYDTSATTAKIGGKTYFAIGKDESDTGDYHVNIFDASGKKVASGGGTEHDGGYWNK